MRHRSMFALMVEQRNGNRYKIGRKKRFMVAV
jgi:hypothetical protein